MVQWIYRDEKQNDRTIFEYRGMKRMKKTIAVLTALCLCLTAVSALAVTPEELRDQFMYYQEMTRGDLAASLWEWTFDSEKREWTGKEEKDGVIVHITGDAAGNVTETVFLCEKDQIYMDDATFPWPLFCFGDLISAYDDLYPALQGGEFMGDFNSYDIAYMTEENGRFIKAYDIGLMFCTEFIPLDDQELFMLRVLHV